MFDWAIIVKYLPILSEAALLTLYISVISLVLGLVFGLAAALARPPRDSPPSSSTVIRCSGPPHRADAPPRRRR